MNPTKYLTLFASLLLAGCAPDPHEADADADADAGLSPTGLTIVATQTTGEIIDAIAVPDDKKSLTIEFEIVEEQERIHVFALGSRVFEGFPSGMMITGRSAESDGLGYVAVHIEAGELVGIDGNGGGPLNLSPSLEDAIQANLKEDTRSPATTITDAD